MKYKTEYPFRLYDQTKKVLVEFNTHFEEAFERGNDVPTQPLEDGKFAADNKRKNPASFDVIVSKCRGYNSDSTIEDTMNTLDSIANSPLILILASKYKVYKNLTLKSWKYINSSEEHGLEAMLSFVEVYTVSRQYAKLPNAKRKGTVNRGIQQVKSPTDPQKSKTKSTLRTLVDKAKSL